MQKRSYMGGQSQDYAHGGSPAMLNGFVGFDTAAPGYYAGFQPSAAVRPTRPVTVKIVCDEAAQNKVTAKLVNEHAYRIVAI